MRFKRVTFSWGSPLLGVHAGRNPASGQKFVHIAPIPFLGLDFELPPYGLNEEYKAMEEAEAAAREEAAASAVAPEWIEVLEDYQAKGWILLAMPPMMAESVVGRPANQQAALALVARIREMEQQLRELTPEV